MSAREGFAFIDVSTECGPVQGVVHNVSTPIWKRPLLAHAFKGPCAQEVGCFPGFAHPSSTEDCLYLNVLAPERSKESIAPLPVLVLFPGGGLVAGAARDYNPINLVREGKVVLVSVDYRLNVFGFFSHPVINAEGHATGNFGFMDQQAALRWVQANNHSFGGDSQNVTIMGESAGGSCVATHLASPASRDLFHKAIIQSGSAPITTPLPTVHDLQQQGVKLADAAGCGDQTSTHLRAVPTAALLAANSLPVGSFGLGRFNFGLMGDGHIIPYRLPEVFARGDFARVPLVMGVTKAEMTWFQAMAEAMTGKIVKKELYASALKVALHLAAESKMVADKVPEDAFDKVLQLYPIARYDHARRGISAVLSDAGPIAGCRRAARTIQRFTNVYLFESDADDSPVSWPAASFSYDSAHTQERASVPVSSILRWCGCPARPGRQTQTAS